MTLNFQSIPVKTLIQLLAEFESKNIIISDAVQNTISINLKNVSWKQAFNTILKTQNLVSQSRDDVLFILSKNEAQVENEKNEKPVSTIFFLHYAKAVDVQKLFKNNMAADTRTNSLIIQDTPSETAKIKYLLYQLDRPVSQVLITARIVNLDQNDEEELGVRFGLSASRHLTGTLNGANEMAKPTKNAEVDPLKRLNVDLPALSKGAGHIGLALFKLSGGAFLDLELSALQSEGRAKIISSPELVASNQEPAIIQAGQEIPYQQQTNNGGTSTAFKKAVLSLKVTPQIIPNGKILLNLQVNQDSRSSKEVLGVPTIDTRQINTQVLVNDKQTVALGGIYEEAHNHVTERIPFFASLPLVGSLFRYQKTDNTKRELVIFVTPTMMKE